MVMCLLQIEGSAVTENGTKPVGVPDEVSLYFRTCDMPNNSTI